MCCICTLVDKHIKKTEDMQLFCFVKCIGGRGGLMVSALVTRTCDPGSSRGRGHCVVFSGKTLHPYSASLHPGV